jgi:hypothetical protein
VTGTVTVTQSEQELGRTVLRSSGLTFVTIHRSAHLPPLSHRSPSTSSLACRGLFPRGGPTIRCSQHSLLPPALDLTVALRQSVMRAVLLKQAGDRTQMFVGEMAKPQVKTDEVLIKGASTSLLPQLHIAHRHPLSPSRLLTTDASSAVQSTLSGSTAPTSIRGKAVLLPRVRRRSWDSRWRGRSPTWARPLLPLPRRSLLCTQASG